MKKGDKVRVSIVTEAWNDTRPKTNASSNNQTDFKEAEIINVQDNVIEIQASTSAMSLMLTIQKV